MKKVLSLIIIGLLGFSMISILVTQVMAPETTIFSDSFEAATIDPFWTVRQDYGTMALSSDQAHSGSQSLKMSSTGGGQREITLSHSFQGVGKGTISVWLYDTSPETETLYADLNGINSALPYGTPGYQFVVGVRDWDAYRYHVGAGGIGEITTSVLRTLGWHQLTLVYSSEGLQAFVDGVQVAFIEGDFGFDIATINLSGPVWRPDATFYFDDFFVQWVPIALPGVPEFEISVTITASVLLCGWLLTQTMVAKWLKTEKRWAKRL